ncbi:hypothetical protein J6590_059322 [Homalodisca vitripennis]|nr:hypothetical protein J6590_059322 [Homalodisca vitripennis]
MAVLNNAGQNFLTQPNCHGHNQRKCVPLNFEDLSNRGVRKNEELILSLEPIHVLEAATLGPYDILLLMVNTNCRTASKTDRQSRLVSVTWRDTVCSPTKVTASRLPLPDYLGPVSAGAWGECPLQELS